MWASSRVRRWRFNRALLPATYLQLRTFTEGLVAMGMSLTHRQDILMIDAVDFSKSDCAMVCFLGVPRRRFARWVRRSLRQRWVSWRELGVMSSRLTWVSITVLQNAVIAMKLLVQFVDPAADSMRLLWHFKLRAVDVLKLRIAQQVLCFVTIFLSVGHFFIVFAMSSQKLYTRMLIGVRLTSLRAIFITCLAFVVFASAEGHLVYVVAENSLTSILILVPFGFGNIFWIGGLLPLITLRFKNGPLYLG